MLETIETAAIAAIAKEAGDAIMEIYRRDFTVEYKEDQSPLTEADLAANAIIVEALKPFGLPILSEEGKSVPYETRKGWESYWCVDPIDGTKEFIKKNDEFTVNIALVHRGVPVMGVVYAPALGEMYSAKRGEGAFKNGARLPLHTNETPEVSLHIVASKSHLSAETQAFIDAVAQTTQRIEQVSRGSSLKLCMVAEGAADLYPRLAPTMEWEIGRAHV